MQSPLRNGDLLELTPDRFGRRGEAEGDHGGWRIRIPGGIPGETVSVRIVHVSRGGPVAAARLAGPVLQAHTGRREPPCAIHERCGGCGLQHIAADTAFELKVEQARRLFGAQVRWQAPIRAPVPLGYRAKSFLIPQRKGSRLLLGARPPRGAQLVDTTGCAVLRPELEALAQRARAVLDRRTDEEGHLRSILLRCSRKGRTQLTLVHRGEPEWLAEAAIAIGADTAFVQRHDSPGNRIHSDREEVQVLGEEPIRERYGEGLEAYVPPTAFVQGNPEVAEPLYGAAAEELGGGRIAELYCGAGMAGLFALRRWPQATLEASDISPRAIAAARANARLNGLDRRCRFRAAPAEAAEGNWDAVCVNPPRSGCQEGVLRAISESDARRLVYLSCSPTTLARDAAVLGWSLRSVTPADMLPQTPHLELLAVFERR